MPSTVGGTRAATRLEALRDTDLAAAHTVTPVTRDAERMASPQFRARLLRMAA